MCRCRHCRHQRADPGSSRLPYLWWLEAFGIWRHQPARHGRREVLDEGQDSHPALAGWFGYWGKRIRDRKSVVSGKSVSVRVDIGGRRILQTKQKKKTSNK